MNKLKRTIIFIMLIMIIGVQLSNNQCSTFASILDRDGVNAGVLLFSFDNLYTSEMKKSLENIEKNKPRIKYTFFSSENSLAKQNEVLDSLLRGNYKLLILNLIIRDKDQLIDIINRGKQRNISLIIFDVNPSDLGKNIELYDKIAFVTTDSKEAGALQGKIIVDKWNVDKSEIDRNNDNVLQYIALVGLPTSEISIERTNSAISTIEKAGIKTELLDQKTASWDKELAKGAIESSLLKYDGRIEAIISNSDSMAIGAIEALQRYGYNKDDKSKYISVVGIDGLQEAKGLVNNGIMTGTVSQDFNDIAGAIYNVGLSLVYNEAIPQNTNYKLINKNIVISEPYKIYTRK